MMDSHTKLHHDEGEKKNKNINQTIYRNGGGG